MRLSVSTLSRRARYIGRRALLIALCVTALAAAGCVPPEDDPNAIVHFSDGTVMGQIQAAGTITIGIASDRPPWGYRTPDGEVEGFTVDMGKAVAARLGVDPRFVTYPNDDLLDKIDEGTVQVAFPATAITEKRIKGPPAHSFTDPFFIGHERLILPAGSNVGADDLDPQKTCDLTDPQIEVDPFASGANEAWRDPRRCAFALYATKAAPSLAKGTARAAIGSDVDLMTVLANQRARALSPNYQIVGDQLSTEGYGAVVQTDAPGFEEVVANILEQMQADGRWDASCTKWIAPVLPDACADGPPTMTVEEAAALFPTTKP
jgi:ABC-type amino acid transport substrate-binding protein